jgi:tRNA dimethylallyltransferase
MTARSDSQPLVVGLYGPTSSGKTALSLRIAERLRQEGGPEVEVISADSRQVYRFMDIGTSKVTPEERALVPHHLIDVTEPRRKLALRDYQALASEAIDDVHERGRLPLVVGGTGTYFESVLGEWVVDDLSDEIERLRQEFPPTEREDALKFLRRIDPAAAREADPRNYERILTAIARAMTPQPEREQPTRRRSLRLGLNPPPRAVEPRIERTLDAQFAMGLYDEVRALEDRYGLEGEQRRLGSRSPNQVLHTHGYREFFECAVRFHTSVRHLSDRQLRRVRDEALEHIVAYSRRQRAWFGKMAGVRFVRTEEDALAALRDLL